MGKGALWCKGYGGECGKVWVKCICVCGVHVCMCGCTCMSTFVCGECVGEGVHVCGGGRV